MHPTLARDRRGSSSNRACSFSICTHLPRVSGEATSELYTPTHGRCCGQRRVQFSSLVGGDESLAHLLCISQLPPSSTERFGSSFILSGLGDSVFSKQARGAVTGVVGMGRMPRSQSHAAT